MTNLSAEQRMEIEETFKDLESLLGMDKITCQKRYWMEQMVCLALMRVYDIMCKRRTNFSRAR
jgi:hypothetical protein